MRRATGSLAGILASSVAVGVTELAAGLLPGGRSIFVAVADAVIGLTPGSVVRFAISTFGSRNRLVLLASMTIVLAVAAAVVGNSAARRWWTGVAGVVALGAIGAVAALVDPLIPAESAVLAPLTGSLAGVAAMRWLLVAGEVTDADTARATDMPGSTRASPGRPVGGRAASSMVVPPRSRRAFIGLGASAVGVALASAAGGRLLQDRAADRVVDRGVRLRAPDRPLASPPASSMFDVPGLSPVLTPTDDFYRIDTAFSVPRIDAATHAVRVTGMVDDPYELTYDELIDLADTEADVTLSCVSNEVGGHLVGTARWLGIPLADVLERAGVHDGATQIVGRAVDGWTSGFPVDAAFDGRPALVAVGMNGEPLPARHGFPVRLVIAGLYGYVSDTKWLSEIEVTTFEAHDAYWIPRGWSERGPIKTQSRIDVPRPGSTVPSGRVSIAGVAWSDERGITRVQVAIDDDPWRPAELAEALASSTWRQWRLAWNALPGEHLLRVRAFDADGIPQTAEISPPAPDGATGHHTIRIRVV